MRKRGEWAIFKNEMLCGGKKMLNKVLQKCTMKFLWCFYRIKNFFQKSIISKPNVEFATSSTNVLTSFKKIIYIFLYN